MKKPTLGLKLGLGQKKENQKKGKSQRADICLSLNCNTLDQVRKELQEFGQYAKYVEWCIHDFDGINEMPDNEFVATLDQIRKWTRGQKLIVCFKGEEEVGNRLLKLSAGNCDFVDIGLENSKKAEMIKFAKKHKVKVILSHHDYEQMPSKQEIAEMYLRMESDGADILKIACMAKEEVDTYEILEGAAMYTSLREHKDIIAVAMGEEGQVSRICAGDFGSVITYASGTNKTAPGQFNCQELNKFMNKYYENK